MRRDIAAPAYWPPDEDYSTRPCGRCGERRTFPNSSKICGRCDEWLNALRTPGRRGDRGCGWRPL